MGKYGKRKEKLWELQERIISLPVFRKNSLRLYCRVPMKDICYIERIEKERPQWIERLKEYQEDNERIPFIICKNDDIIASVGLKIGTTMIGHQRIIGVPFLNVEADQMWKREFYCLNDYIEELLHSERRGIAKYHARPIALVALKYGNLLSPEWKDMSMQELQEILEKQHLLERKTEISFIREKEQIREVFVPSKYGEEIGMIKGFSVNERGKVYCRPFCSELALEEIGKILEWKHKNKNISKRKPIPFAERMERLNRGLPSDSTCGISVIRSFAKLSIEEYLKDFPKELEELKAILKEHGKLEENMDYQSVAVAIYQIFQSDKKEDGKKLMEILVKPADKKYNEIVEKKNDGKTNV